MEPLSRRISIAIAIICIALNANAQSPDFPEMSKIEASFYQTEVTITDVNQQMTGLAKEYFDNTVPRGKVELLVIGERTSIQYNNDTKEVLHWNSTTCNAYDADIAEDAYIPLFYGWLNKVPLIIGPSAPLWYAQDHRSEIKGEGETIVRNIKCYKYSLNITGPRDNITLYYYFAVDKWTTPYGMDGLTKVPVRIEVQGWSSKYAENEDEKVPYDLITDFAYFRPTIDDWLAFQPPVGIGCHLKKATRTMPKFPKVFLYDAEVYDFIKSKDDEITDIEHHSVWYDSTRMIARLDRYTRQNYISELYDFNTGVTYTNTNWQTCTIKPLKNSFFEGYDGKLIGHLKYPNEVLNLDGTFYYMGTKLIRGIWTDAFESLQEDVVFQGKTLKKLVVTAYYSQDFYKVAVNGETESQIPVFYIVTGWSTATDIAVHLQYNIFGFDDVIWPEMYQTFGIGRCFPLMETKSYFLMIVDATPDLAGKMEESDELVKQEIRGEIATFAKVSDMRIPLLTIDYKTNGVFITGLLLDRPPAIKQFWLEYTGDVAIADPYMKIVVDGDSYEKCAYACVDEGDFTCTGFHMCKNACFLKSKDLLDPTGDDEKKTPFGEVCETWMRATRDSLNNENYLKDALEKLENSVLNQNFTLAITITKNDVLEEMIIPISNIVIGDGPYTGDNNQEKPYTKVVNFNKLKENVSTSEEVPYTETLNDCYKACKSSGSLSCASFSYCPDTNSKECRISSVLVVDKKKNIDDVDEDPKCYVYSVKYMDFFEEYPGRIVLIGGKDSFNQVKTVEDCAKRCRDATEAKRFDCRGFEYCRSARTCVLHEKHVMDLKPGEVTKVDKKSNCIHYAAKFSADYEDKGYTIIVDDTDKRSELTLEECSRICSEELKDNCRSFNYCPASGPYMTDSSCSLSGKVLSDRKVTTTTKDKCHYYEKKRSVDDWKKSSKNLSTVGYTSKGFTGLVIGMLALGLVLGAMGFVAYSYFRSKSSGEGMTVRFMKSDI